jgi:hypothetical protein
VLKAALDPFEWADCSNLFSSRPVGDLNPFLSLIHFLGFYLLGMCASITSDVTDDINARRSGQIIVAFSLIVFLVVVWWSDSSVKEPLGFMDGWGRLNLIQLGKLSLLIAVFLFFEKHLVLPRNFLGYLADNSFGLFFIHGFFMVIFLKVNQYLAVQNPFGVFSLEFGLVILGSMLTVSTVRSVLGKKSRYVIGC